ncbi:MAG: phosphopyruvate hydratase [Patescibacteria group bacterium]|jgi:enolase|nr:phosphopyruvate hydratase [Patescibacteria group bacterium]
MTKIKEIKSREILDSRGNPTLETKIILENGVWAKASVPSGASTGIHEAWELRDGDEKRYEGKGVLKAVENVNTKINKALSGFDVGDQKNIDQTMIDLDGSENKKNLGANAILSVSMAAARTAALDRGVELYEHLADVFELDKNFKIPTPSFNIFNGGSHADTNLDFQEFMILPLRDTSVAEKIRMGAEIFHELGRVLKKAGMDTDVGNEGGYAPDIYSSVQAIELIIAAIINAGFKPGEDIGLGMDVGASEFYNRENKKYIFKLDQSQFTKNDLIGLYNEWFRKFPIIAIEDGLEQDDWEGWRELNKELGGHMLLIGDDLFVTNIKRLRQGLKEKAANALLVKPNQVGSITETVECVLLAQKHGLKTMASHRSGETTDTFIADLSVALGTDYIKSGSLSRSERLAKYNRLMEIEMKLKGEF